MRSEKDFINWQIISINRLQAYLEIPKKSIYENNLKMTLFRFLKKYNSGHLTTAYGIKSKS